MFTLLQVEIFKRHVKGQFLRYTCVDQNAGDADELVMRKYMTTLHLIMLTNNLETTSLHQKSSHSFSCFICNSTIYEKIKSSLVFFALKV